MMRARDMILLALVASALGCVAAAPEGDPGLRCNVDFSCRGDELCEVDGRCYGKPNAQQTLAIEILPPEGSAEFVKTELASASFEGDKLVLVIDKPFEVQGHVLAGSERIAGRVVARRRQAIIPGRPDYTVEAVASTDRGYLLKLPAGDKALWDVMVFPLSSTGPGMAEGPPVMFPVEVSGNLTFDFKLPAPSAYKKAKGKIVDSVGRPVGGVAVQAYGKLSTSGGNLPSVEMLASQSVTTLADGTFQLSVPLRLHSEFRLAINAGQRRTDMPEVSFPGIFIPEPMLPTDIFDIGGVVLPVFSAPQRFTFRVHGTTAAGKDEGAVGARVTFSTEWGDAPDTGCDGLGRCAHFSVEAFADPTGAVTVDLLPGTSQKDRPYEVLVLTVSDSPLASKSGERITVGAQGGVGQELALERKVTLVGRILDATLQPHTGVQVIARPSAAYKVNLSSIEQTVLDAIQVPSTLTPQSMEFRQLGTFVLAVEPSLLGTSGDAKYDLEVIPPADVPMPRFFIDDVLVDPQTVDPMTRTLDIGERIAPEAVTVRGVVVDSNGVPLEGARVLIYEPAPPTACAQIVMGACVVPPRLLSVAETSSANLDSGFVAILPRR